ncbi:transglycosylase SLT domain-containing protein [Bacteriovorax sp. Seq25_V]|uniref:transglycosylase SLT domain-containing protein n=1 Tax=Bacteriovorax sp. Seq25_V TaxID=1201288 RepID=UPI00038A3919|nr:transglycosylase SLT domain-containing protein [Bacteriovorax sp. Seq25_V]EQC46002.1 transglycosylase SLT domain protein [Bacteriovorax sp. Seq25_V]
MKFLKFYLFILLNFSVLAGQVMTITSDRSVIVRYIDGNEQYLNEGDTIEILDPENWKRHIRIIKTSNPLAKRGAAILGNNRYNELVSQGYLKRKSLAAIEENILVVNAPIEIELANKKKVILQPGDTLKLGAKDGWKRKISVLSSASGVKGDAAIGDQTLNGYISDKVVKKQVAPSSATILQNEDALDLLFKRFSFPKDKENEIEDESSDEAFYTNTECPKSEKTFKLRKSTSIISVPGKYDTIPEGTVVKTSISENGVCRFSVVGLPQGSRLAISDFPTLAATYPSNMGIDNLDEVEDPNSILNLEKGLVFKLPDGAKVRAVGRRTGKSYSFDANDRIEIVGKHTNGSYIVKRNGERFEYRLDANALDELNNAGALSINFNDTAGNIMSNNSFNTAVEYDEVDCQLNNSNEVDDTYADDEDYESCRDKTIKTNKGPLKPNDYLSNILDFKTGVGDVDSALIDTYTECISKSMLSGTANNAAPSCKKDSHGNVIPQKIRERVKNSKGQFYSRLADKRPRACANRKTSEYLAKSFLSAASCLGVDPKEFFPIINHESHFQPTAVSPTFATGIGQIIPKTYNDFYQAFRESKSYIDRNHSLARKIQRLNESVAYENYEKNDRPVRRLTAYMLAHLQDKVKSNDPNCAGLKRMYNDPYKGKTHADVVKQENIRLCAPSNPSEDFFISMIMYQQNKKYSTYMLNEINKVSKKKMSKDKVREFSKILSRWMYNGGEKGIYTVFELFAKDLSHNRVEELGRNGRITGKKLVNKSLADLSTDEFKNYFSHYLKYRYNSKSTSRKNEVASYVPGTGGTGGIDGDLAVTEGRGKRECGN